MEIYKKDKKVRSKKLKARVDLTAMVSVSFLLIIFFMVTTELGKPKAIDLGLPEKYPGWSGCGKGIEDRVLTVLLDDNDRIVFYSGFLEWSMDTPKELKYGKDGIRKELYNKNKSILEYSANIGRPNRGAIVIIKPSKKSNYKNLVDILDEMAIAKIETYTIVNDFTPEESKLLAAR
ncbi:biopolymer transporter ExbD [Flavobacterium sp. 140616W15]|uniref:ExbD/TolR family protein n=1 Tax=Flavobacterium sp. 140616W15 TaxID=2478552 RepID=UPI000F0C8632|nr:biopolymer transporter ExbD [Flavobacterium sp. 140616W15]AYN03352.1 biopolymer transporter ExbD [Flavobacterium sp. 140616W15]